MSLRRLPALPLLALAVFAQPPAILQEGVRNAASLMPPSLPGGGLARGARIVIQGLRFKGRAEIVLNGRIRVQPIALRPDRLEAILPATVPLGDSTVQVRNEEGASRAVRVRVVAHAFGIARTGPNWIEGTGLGLIVNPAVIVGGRPVKLLAIRNAGPWTRITFEPPALNPSVCHLPVYVQLPGPVVSNVATIHSVCRPDRHWPISTARRSGSVILARSSVHFDDPSDDGRAAFAEGLGEATPAPPEGGCLVITRLYDAGSSPLPVFDLTPAGRWLDAGPALETGTRQLTPAAVLGNYVGWFGGYKPPSRPRPLLFGDTATVQGKGGRDVGPFLVTVPMPAPLRWTDGDLPMIDRTRDLTFNWEGGGNVALFVSSVDELTTASTFCYCRPAAGTQRFTVPSAMLANLPASRSMSYAGLVALGATQAFQAAGIDEGRATAVRLWVRPAIVE